MRNCRCIIKVVLDKLLISEKQMTLKITTMNILSQTENNQRVQKLIGWLGRRIFIHCVIQNNIQQKLIQILHYNLTVAFFQLNQRKMKLKLIDLTTKNLMSLNLSTLKIQVLCIDHTNRSYQKWSNIFQNQIVMQNKKVLVVLPLKLLILKKLLVIYHRDKDKGKKYIWRNHLML